MKWRLFICSDCDTDDGAIIMQVPDDVGYYHSCVVEFCPGCDSHLSMLGTGDVEVSGTALVHLNLRTPAEEPS